jgi:hypothetical protein
MPQKHKSDLKTPTWEIILTSVILRDHRTK